MTARRSGRSTTAIHGAPQSPADWSPVVPALMQSSTFVSPVDSDEEIIYSRYGNNPNQVALARKYALLEGAEEAVFLASGMGATALAHLAVLRPGDHLVSSRWIYGGTQALFDQQFGRFGIEITYVEPDKPRAWRKSVRKSTRAIFVETPTNPLMRILDLAPVAQVAREFGLALLVDATFASPINFRPLEHGADVAITSATKYLNGHSDVIAGAVAGSASIVEEVIRLMQLWGQSIDPHAAWLVDRGMRTLALRMERHNANGMAVARWAEGQPGLPRSTTPDCRATRTTTWRERCSTASAGSSVSSSRAAPERRPGCWAGSSWSFMRRASAAWRRWSPSLAAPRTRGSPRGTRGARVSRRLPAPELRGGGCGGHHRRSGAGAEVGDQLTADSQYSPFPLIFPP